MVLPVELKTAVSDVVKQGEKKSPPPIKKITDQSLPGLVLADPPWQYSFSKSDSRNIEGKYPTQTLEQIIANKPETQADCILLLWATAPKLVEALAVIVGWGFKYKTHAVWDKRKIGMGYWFRGQHELLLVGTKGKPALPEPEKRVSSIFVEPRGVHSAKPEIVRQWIESAFTDLKKLEMYARQKREGWLSWGNEPELAPGE
jgi:N6-adenosine-specific RNA methylase IME4